MYLLAPPLTASLLPVAAITLPAWTSSAAICLLWLSRRLPKRPRVAVAAALGILTAVVWSQSAATVDQSLNALIMLACAIGCLVVDLVPGLQAESGSSETDVDGPASWRPSAAVDDDATNVLDNNMVLNLEELAPEIDAVSAQEFAQRAARVGVFSSEQVATLEHLIESHQQLSVALRQAVSQKTLTVYQALHLLWGKEDRLKVGPYTLMNVLGVGGMSVVYRARKLAGGNEIALKVVPKATRHEARFRREMQLAQLLAHPNIVVAYEVGECIDRYYIAMELITGRNLQDVVRLHGSLSEAVALQYLLQAARGLEHAHERGVIHRDVKPGNLLLCQSGIVKVADLGLSQEAGGTDVGCPVRGAVSGTVDFMAPEQANPNARSVPQIDVYGLGTTLFYLLTGKPRVAGRTTQEKMMNLTVGRRFNRLPSGCTTARTMNLLNRMTAWDSANRFSSMSSVITELEGILREMGRDHAARHLHVLVVEDDPAHLFLTVRLLSRTNRAIHVSKSQRLDNATDTFRASLETERPVDLVLLDLNLPDSSGIETLQKLKAIHPDAAIVVLTSDTAADIQDQCDAAGAAGFICKMDLNLSTLERTLFTIQSQIRNRMLTD